MNNPRSRTQMHVMVFLRTDDERGEYMRACARIRDVSITRLAQILIDKIAEDQLTEAVLDDGGDRRQRAKYERRYRRAPL